MNRRSKTPSGKRSRRKRASTGHKSLKNSTKPKKRKAKKRNTITGNGSQQSAFIPSYSPHSARYGSDSDMRSRINLPSLMQAATEISPQNDIAALASPPSAHDYSRGRRKRKKSDNAHLFDHKPLPSLPTMPTKKLPPLPGRRGAQIENNYNNAMSYGVPQSKSVFSMQQYSNGTTTTYTATTTASFHPAQRSRSMPPKKRKQHFEVDNVQKTEMNQHLPQAHVQPSDRSLSRGSRSKSTYSSHSQSVYSANMEPQFDLFDEAQNIVLDNPSTKESRLKLHNHNSKSMGNILAASKNEFYPDLNEMNEEQTFNRWHKSTNDIHANMRRLSDSEISSPSSPYNARRVTFDISNHHREQKQKQKQKHLQSTTMYTMPLRSKSFNDDIPPPPPQNIKSQSFNPEPKSPNVLSPQLQNVLSNGSNASNLSSNPLHPSHHSNKSNMSFGLGAIVLPKEPMHSYKKRKLKKKRKRIRRNSDSMLATPTIEDSSFMRQMMNPNALNLRDAHSGSYDKDNDYVPPITPNSPDSMQMIKEESFNPFRRDSDALLQPVQQSMNRSHSAPETPNTEAQKMLPQSFRSFRSVRGSSAADHTNRDLIDKLLGFKGSRWNFDNELVDLFEEQCKRVQYQDIVPPLIDIEYPTTLSSLALPQSAKKMHYSMTVKYNLSQIVSVEERIVRYLPNIGIDSDEERMQQIMFNFTFETTIQVAIEQILHKIKKRHKTFIEYLNKCHAKCFILKVCGREEYLKHGNGLNKIAGLSHIRNCIRRGETRRMALNLVYDDSQRRMNDLEMRNLLRASYNSYYEKLTPRQRRYTQSLLQYEQSGFNVITKTLNDSIGCSNLAGLNQDIEKELKWLRNEVESIHDEYAMDDDYDSSKADIDWKKVDRKGVLLNEFEHPIEFSIASLSNIMLCDRFRMKNNKYFVYILRVELMFGSHVFENCSYDIIIPKSKISNNISMPFTFSTEEECLFYSALPREAIWTFTLYGIKRDKEIAEEIKNKRKKHEKKNKKREPKILRGFLQKKASKQSNGSNGSGLDGTDYLNEITARTIAEDEDRMISTNEINDFWDSHAMSPKDDVKQSDDANFNPYSNQMKSQYSSEPMAWCRLPMVDHMHCLRKGTYNLLLWTVPIFEKQKGGPKIDPYKTGNWKKFGSMRDQGLKNKGKGNSVVLTVNFKLKYKFNVVAPIVNERRPPEIRNKVKSHSKRRKKQPHNVLNQIIQRDGIFPMDERDKLLVYSNKEKLMKDPATIPTFLRSVNWLDSESRMEAYDYLEAWAEPSNPEDMIELLRYEFADNRVRLYAINCLNQLDDHTLQQCLLQLVQALKNEIHHSSFLARFLISRALHNPFQIGHYLFWHLKSEFHDKNLEFVERAGVLLKEYLMHLPYYPGYTNVNLVRMLSDEQKLINSLKFISMTIKNAKFDKRRKWSKEQLTNLLRNQLMRLNNELFPQNDEKFITLPLNPSYKVGRLQYEKCRFMSSAKVPLWLVFDSSDSFHEKSIEIMFKCGDDLRQDILTLQLISIMDAFWLSSSIDLNMRTYQVIGTGYQVGLLELMLDSRTINEIGSSFNNKTHLKYINTVTEVNKHLNFSAKKSNYARSVAGFSVATWTLGIGDRHPDNIMLHQDGTLFHIDFGHFLGNFKMKDIGGLGVVKWKRERTPFVFTNAMKTCIEAKSKGTQKRKDYTQFVKWIFSAYCEIRTRYKFFLNLLLLMVPSQMPELITEGDCAFFREILRFDLTDDHALASHVEGTLKTCLSDTNKKWDDWFHKINHM